MQKTNECQNKKKIGRHDSANRKKHENMCDGVWKIQTTSVWGIVIIMMRELTANRHENKSPVINDDQR